MKTIKEKQNKNQEKELNVCEEESKVSLEFPWRFDLRKKIQLHYTILSYSGKSIVQARLHW